MAENMAEIKQYSIYDAVCELVTDENGEIVCKKFMVKKTQSVKTSKTFSFLFL